jgi:hypothetical protein
LCGLDKCIRTTSLLKKVSFMRHGDLKMMAASLGISIHERTLALLDLEPALVPPLIAIIQRIAPSLHGWDGGGSVSIDSFADPDTDLPEAVRLVFHPSDDKEWDEVMEKWDEVSDELTKIIPLKSMRKRIIVSFEPEF